MLLRMFVLVVLFVIPGPGPASAADSQKPLRALLITGGCCHNYQFQSSALIEGVARGKKADGEVLLDNAKCLFVAHVSAAMVGGRVRVKVVKNKVGAPFKTTEFDLLYNEGISHEGELIALGEKFKLVEKSGASYRFGDIALGRGYDATRTFLRENKQVLKELTKQVMEKLKSGGLESAGDE